MKKKKKKKKVFPYRLRSKVAATGETTIWRILETIPQTSTFNLFPRRRRDKNGVKKTEEAVDSEVITMLRGAIVGSVKNVA